MNARNNIALALCFLVALLGLTSCDDAAPEMTDDERCTMYIGCLYQCIALQAVQGDPGFDESRCEQCIEFSPREGEHLLGGGRASMAAGADAMVRSTSVAEPIDHGDIDEMVVAVELMCSEY